MIRDEQLTMTPEQWKVIDQAFKTGVWLGLTIAAVGSVIGFGVGVLLGLSLRT